MSNLQLKINTELKNMKKIFNDPILQIIRKLLFSSFIVGIPMPYLHLNDILLSQIINDHIRLFIIPCSCLNIIIPCSINDRFQKKHKISPAIRFQEFFISITVNIIKIFYKLFKNTPHIQRTIMYKLIF